MSMCRHVLVCTSNAKARASMSVRRSGQVGTCSGAAHTEASPRRMQKGLEKHRQGHFRLHLLNIKRAAHRPPRSIKMSGLLQTK